MDFIAEDHSINALDQNTKSRSFIKNHIKTLYKTLIDAYQEPSSNIEDIKRTSTWFFVLHLIFYFQYTSLYWKPDIGYKSWKTYEKFWLYLSFLRIDPIFYILNIQSQAYYTFSALVYFDFLILVLTVFASSHKKEIPKLLKWLFQKTIYIQNTFLFIPILTFFSAIIANFIRPSEIYNDQAGQSLGIQHLPNCLFCLFLHICTSFLYEIMTFEVRHSLAHVNYESKSTCMIDFKKMMSTIITVELYCFLPVSRLEISHGLNIIVSTWLSVLYLLYIPYYNKSMNTIVFGTTACELFTAFFFILTYIIQSSGFLMLSTIFIIPFIALSVNRLIEFRYSLIKTCQPKECRNAFHLEINMRKSMTENEEPDIQPLLSFGEYANSRSDNIDSIALWECSHCIYNLKDFKLAYIKLAKINKYTPSLTTDFQAYRLKHILKKNNKLIPEDLQFMKYVQKLEKMKELDKNVTESLIFFAAELVSEEFSMKKLNYFIEKLCANSKTVADGYIKMKKKYPKGKEGISLLKSFLLNIFPNSKLDAERIKYDFESTVSLNGITYFDEENGVILVSSELSNLGTIVYINEQFGHLINESPSSILGNNLSLYIPYPYSFNHNKTMLKYSQTCTSSTIRFPGTLFLQTQRGYLVECYIKTTCITLKENIFYLVLARKILCNRASVLISISGIIYSHSDNFSQIVTFDAVNCKNFHINDILPDYPYDSIKLNEPFKIRRGKKMIFIVKTHRVIGNSEINLLLLADNDNDLQSILAEETGEKRTEDVIDLIRKLDREKLLDLTDKINPEGFENDTSKFLNSTLAENYSKNNVDKNVFEEKIEQNQKGKGKIVLEKVSKSINNSLKLIRLMKLLFFFAVVIFIVSNAVTTYLISKSMLTGMLTYYGKFITFMLNISVKINYTFLPDYPDLQFQKDAISALLLEYSSIQDSINSELRHWSFCPCSQILQKHNSISLYALNNITYSSSESLHDFIDILKKSTNRFLLHPEDRENTEFLMVNSMIKVYNELQIYYEKFIECTEKIVENFNTANDIIIISQISLLVLCAVLKISEVIKILANYNSIWNTISEYVHKNYYSIRDKCIMRLTDDLYIDENDAFVFYDYAVRKKNKFSLTFYQFLSQTWIIIIFIAVSFTYFLIVSQIYYTKIGKNYQDLTKFKFTLYMQDFALYQMDFWTTTGITNVVDNDLQHIYFNENLKDYFRNKLNIHDQDISRFVGEDIFKGLFEKNTLEEVKFGIVEEIELAIYDSMYFNKTRDRIEINKFCKRMGNIRSLLEEYISLVNVNSDKIIDNAFTNILIWVVTYAVFAFFMLFVVYLPFLKKEEKYFQQLLVVLEILVN